MKKAIILFFLLTSLNTAIWAQETTTGIKFEDSSWSEIIEKAKAQNKIIFMDAFASWCGPCKWMAKNTFTDKAVANFYNKKFICAKIDMEKGEGIELRKKYKVRAFPTLLYINPTGEVVHKVVGGIDPEEFIQVGKIAIDPEKRLGTYLNKYQNDKLSNQEIPYYLHLLDKAYMDKEKVLDDYFATQKTNDLTSTLNWKIIHDHVDDIDAKEFKFLIENQHEFNKISTPDSVNTKIYNTFLSKIYRTVFSRTYTSEQVEELKDKIKQSGYKNSHQLIAHANLILAQRLRQWDKYANHAITLINEKKYFDPVYINNISWNIYKNIEDATILEHAVRWAKKAAEAANEAAYLDTYANLLYKTGKKQEAIKNQKKAIATAKEKNEDTEDYQKTLDKMQKKE